MKCERCNKRLSRKTARLIDGEVLCSTCMFAPRKSGVTRKGGDRLRAPVSEAN